MESGHSVGEQKPKNMSFHTHARSIAAPLALMSSVSVVRVMPRFHFKVDGPPDDLGMDLPSLSAAKCEAVRYAGRLLCGRASEFWDTGDFMMTVADDQGLTLFSLQFSAVEAPAIRSSH